MTGTAEFSAAWLALREPADAAARSAELAALAAGTLPPGRAVVRDLGCGTGAMARWLAGRLPAGTPGPRWILHDRDPALLAEAAARLPAAETRLGDLAALDARGTDLVIASALLDVLTAAELDRLAAIGCPALLALTVTGRVELDPPGPRDAAFTAAFNDHQRRGGRLGPDAVPAAVAAFRGGGFAVRVRPSPWRLGPADAALVTAWLRGWVAAAVEQDPGLAAHADAYLARPPARVTVHHADLLAVPA
ncbi:methyltransferase domain-containing protein [Actinomadura parmotrematis]|uniref:SAM-dependent methyltransferase n=1 Tax=Actinomadura parmotrematis TaxID=2864039 RepID=A0ABS7FLR5_9ACTN|nr:methyltransferase domain-containing protein [Actinomadura parmotrematis]MBW8481325.1 SAM-dependent methyltransferase [Actinomadura parmotrematis]